MRTRTLRLGERTVLMAIVNLTPDSFSGDGLADLSVEEAVATAIQRIDGGADIIDFGAESTRPGAQPLDADEEQERLLPVLEAVLRLRPAAVISVDTYHAATARAAAREGAEIVNDVSGLLWDERMAAVVAEERTGLVLSHTRGKPPQWANQPALPGDSVVPLVLEGLRERLDAAHTAGIVANRIVVDPGFGFGKRGVAENFALLSSFDRFHELGRPLLAGLSRKGFLTEAIADLRYEGEQASEARLNASTAANVAAILAGAHILRIHDLQEAREAAAIADEVLASQQVSESASQQVSKSASQVGKPASRQASKLLLLR